MTPRRKIASVPLEQRTAAMRGRIRAQVEAVARGRNMDERIAERLQRLAHETCEADEADVVFRRWDDV